MPKIFLSTYMIRVKDRRQNYVPLGNFGNNNDLFNIFNNYLNNAMQSPIHDHFYKSLLSISNPSVSGREVSGIIKKGEYGFESDLIDVQNQNISHRRTVIEAEMLPFYFLAKIPDDTNEGILILQKTGKSSIYGTLQYNFKRDFKIVCPEFSVEFNPLVPEELIDQYLKDGLITQVNLTRFSYPKDIADAFYAQDHGEIEEKVQLIITTKELRRFPFIDRIKEVFNNTRLISKFVELQYFDYDKVKLIVNMGGNQRTLDLGDMSKFRPNYDISDEIRIGPDGHPEIGNMHEIASKLLEEISKGIYI